MRTFALIGLMTGVLLAQDPAPRPWMQGSVEKYCHSTPADIARMRKQYPDKAEHILLCKCQHQCDPLYEHAPETDDRVWDAKCEARCSPSNCNCKHPCES